jgi:hypothetical protein
VRRGRNNHARDSLTTVRTNARWRSRFRSRSGNADVKRCGAGARSVLARQLRRSTVWRLRARR